MKLGGLFVANLALLSSAITLPVAHVFALPQSDALDAGLWSQGLSYFREAWRIYAGGAAVAACLMSLVLYIWRRKGPVASRLSLNAVFIYAALSTMIVLTDAARFQHSVAFCLAAFGWLVLVSASLVVAGVGRPAYRS